MASANTTGVRSRADHRTIAPTFPLSAADKAAHAAASYVRPVRAVAGDSDPDMDEALRRVQENLAYIERAQQFDAQVAAEIAAGVAA